MSSSDDPIPVSIPVEPYINAVQERQLVDANQIQYYVIGIYLYVARFPEFIQHTDCSDDSKRIMKEICKRLDWNMNVPIWEVLTYENATAFITKEGNRDFFEKKCHAVHTDLIKNKVLILPTPAWALPPISITRISHNYVSQENKRNKRKRSEEGKDPALRVQKRRLRREGESTSQKRSVDTTRHPLWKSLLRYFEKYSLLSFTSGSTTTKCLYIKDHARFSQSKKYLFSLCYQRKSYKLHIEKFLRFYLNPSSFSYRTKPPNAGCRQLKSTSGCFLCLNPFHYG